MFTIGKPSIIFTLVNITLLKCIINFTLQSIRKIDYSYLNSLI